MSDAKTLVPKSTEVTVRCAAKPGRMVTAMAAAQRLEVCKDVRELRLHA